MKKGKFINKDHKSNDPKIDKWIITKRDAILDWFDGERLKADYNTASDEEMLTAIASHVQKMCYADPSHWWYNVLCEIAECVLDLDDEWKIGHYDIEEWLLDNIKWRKQIKVGSRVMWCGSWGRNPAEETTVESIEKTTEPHCKEGTAVDCIDFDERDCSVMVLTNGHWCYGDQIVDVLD